MSNNYKERVNSEDWDMLIILDSCRYDFYEEFAKFFPGLSSTEPGVVVTPGGWTGETAPKVFDGSYDMDLYLSHPGLNSSNSGLGDEWEDIAQNFSTVHDLWEIEKSDLTMLPPAKNVVNYIIDNPPSGRSLVWIMQPHAPHIGTIVSGKGRHHKDTMRGIEIYDGEERSSSEIRRRRVGHKYNLLYVLYHISRLLGVIDGTTVITSDHGQLLHDYTATDDGFGHYELNNVRPKQRKILETVPWHKIDASDAPDIDNMDAKQFVRLMFNLVFSRSPKDETVTMYENHLKEKFDYGRREFVETLLHSDEFQDKHFDPHRLCKGYPVDGEDIETIGEKRLKGLGYL